jgi:hypothetical protein
VVVDLAAGTGKLTRELARSRARMIAVGPLDELRAVLGRVVPAAELVAATPTSFPSPTSRSTP